MAMFDPTHDCKIVRALRPATITQSATRLSSAIDLLGYNGALIVVMFGDIDEMGTSPVGNAAITINVTHSDDDSTYANVADIDIIGYSSITSGNVTAPTTDANDIQFGYVGGKRYIKVLLTAASAVANGGPIAVEVIKRFPSHGPAA